jgi:phosphate-selective porin
MRKISLLGSLCLILASAASAAEVYGTVSQNGKPLPQGVALKLDCGGGSASATTDQFGSYSLKTAASGDCRLTVEYKGSSPSLKVTLYEKPSRYDLVIKEESGKLTVERK